MSGGTPMNSERLINTFLDLVKINSVSKDEKSLALELKSRLEKMGFETYIDDADKIRFQHWKSYSQTERHKNVPPIMLSAHMDTVNPGYNIKPQIIDGVIRSDGTTILGADDKAGIAAILEAVTYIIENNIPMAH